MQALSLCSHPSHSSELSTGTSRREPAGQAHTVQIHNHINRTVILFLNGEKAKSLKPQAFYARTE